MNTVQQKLKSSIEAADEGEWVPARTVIPQSESAPFSLPVDFTAVFIGAAVRLTGSPIGESISSIQILPMTFSFNIIG